MGEGREARALLNVHHLQEIDFSERRPSGWRDAAVSRWAVMTEHRLLRRFQHVRSCSPRLVAPIQAINRHADVQVVPVGLDSGLYPMRPARQAPTKTICLIGQMGWYPSYSAAVRLLTRIWPKVHAAVPDARVKIIGWSARRALADYLATPGVEVLEDVPDVRPHFEQADVFVYAPSRGSGMKIKILEAMAYGTPVVTTSEGVEGLPAVDGVHAGICEDDAGLTERTIALLRDSARQERQRHAARRLIETHCSPAATVAAVEALYARLGATRLEAAG
jgi:glycosyltransferase involved in cell wall biosynthesis